MTQAVARHGAGLIFGAAVAAAAIGFAAGSAALAQDAAKPQTPPGLPQLNTLRDVWLALEICWRANEPPLEQARPGMNVTVMLTFTRSGALQGEPRFTYVTREASAETKGLYERAVVTAINGCTPLPFTEGLGNAVAGRPHTIRFIDRRNEKGT
jgi:hypothetical protein